MKTEPFTLATASDVVIFDTLVKVIRFDEGSAGGLPVIIKVKSLSGGAYEVELKPGRQITLPELTRGVVISNLSGAAMTGKITIGAGAIEDNAVIGEVSVVDGGRARTMANLAFLGFVGLGVSGANLPHAQIFNPAGSGRLCIITRAFNSVGVGGYCNLSFYATQLTTLVGTPRSKKDGGAGISSMQLRSQYAGAALNPGAVALNYNIQANGFIPLQLTEPIVLQPGMGLLFQGAPGGDLNTTVEFTEQTI